MRVLTREKIEGIFTPDFIATFFNYLGQYGLRVGLIIVIPLFLDGVTKGYWFTFGSVAALSMLADLGFTTIITQFSAHEFTYFSFEKGKRKIDNNGQDLAQIASLFKFSIKWSLVATIVSSLLIFTVGTILFAAKDDNVSWLLPWILYVLATGLQFFFSVCCAFFEGCKCISICQKIKLTSNIINSVLSIGMLIMGCGLYALSVPLALSSSVSLILIAIVFGDFIKQLTATQTDNIKQWIKPIVNLLWRYAISWFSGYIIYQIYTPLSFAKYGAEMSGKVGYTLTIVSAIVSFSGIWNYISIPHVNCYVEKKDWSTLDRFFKRNLLLIEGTYVLLLAALSLLLIIPLTRDFISKYILLGLPLICLIIGYAVQMATAYIAVYLRAHKEEPLMYSSMVTALIALVITFISVSFFDYRFIFCGFCLATTLVFPWVCSIFKSRRKILH